MSCPNCGNNAKGTVIFRCDNCTLNNNNKRQVIYCMTWEGTLWPRQVGGCGKGGYCPICRKSKSTRLRTI